MKWLGWAWLWLGLEGFNAVVTVLQHGFNSAAAFIFGPPGWFAVPECFPVARQCRADGIVRMGLPIMDGQAVLGVFIQPTAFDQGGNKGFRFALPKTPLGNDVVGIAANVAAPRILGGEVEKTFQQPNGGEPTPSKRAPKKHLRRN